MSANANIVNLTEGKSTLVRPRFSPGLLLRDDDLKVGVDYTRDLSRLLFRSLFGCGVVCGLKVTVDLTCGKLLVKVDPGVALNPMGDPIHVPSPTTVKIDPTCGKEIPPKIWVTLCRTEKCCAPRTAVCGCEEEDSASVCTREQEGFEIRLTAEKPGDCACMCEEILIPDPPKNGESQRPLEHSECWCANPCGCLNDHYSGECHCACGDPECVVLAVLSDVSRDDDYTGQIRKDAEAKGQPWLANHSVRRFIRPVLMRDPIVLAEQTWGRDPCEEDAEPEQITEDSTPEFSKAAKSGDAVKHPEPAAKKVLKAGVAPQAAAEKVNKSPKS